MSNYMVNVINTIVYNYKNKSNFINSELSNLGINYYIKNNKNILDQYTISLSCNEGTYNKFILPKNNIDYNDLKRKIKTLSDDDVTEFVSNNMNIILGIGDVQKYLLKRFIKICKKEELIKESKIEISFKNALKIKSVVNNNFLKLFIEANSKLKCIENNFYIKSKIFTVDEYINNLKKNGKYDINYVNSFKKIKAAISLNNDIIFNLDCFCKLYLNYINIDDFYLEIEKVIYHEIFHKIQEEKINADGLLDTSKYRYLKEKKIRINNYDYYNKYHDYFDIEIDANIYAYKKLIEKYRNKKEIILNLKNKLYNEKLKKYSKNYDNINNEFEKLVTNNKLKLNSNFELEYKNNKKLSTKELISNNNKINNEVTLDNLFNDIFLKSLDEIKEIIKTLNEDEIKIFNKALVYGKIKFIEIFNLMKESNSVKNLIYIKQSLVKLENINLLIDVKKINNKKRR